MRGRHQQPSDLPAPGREPLLPKQITNPRIPLQRRYDRAPNWQNPLAESMRKERFDISARDSGHKYTSQAAKLLSYGCPLP